MGEKMKKALLITTVSGFVPQFEMNNVKILQELRYEVHYAANYKTPVYGEDNSRLNYTGIIQHQVEFVRSPFRIFKNIKALYQLIQVMRKNKYDLVHCHTPMGGVLGRIAALLTKTKPVIYTAHGFHFYKGAPLLNWLIYYPVERILARYTDGLIVINKEDEKNAQKFLLRNKGKIWHIKGIGLNKESLRTRTKYLRERKKLKVPLDHVLLVNVGELNKNKNQIQIIKMMRAFKNSKIICFICGRGSKMIVYENLIKKYHLEKQVILMGYREDISDILKAADIFIFPSKREGLPVALMEAMQAGLPVVCSKIRGNVDLIKEGKGGYLITAGCEKDYANKIKKLAYNHNLRERMGNWNQTQIKKYSLKRVDLKMRELYEHYSSDYVNL